MHEADLKHSQDKIQKKLEQIYALRRTRSKVNWDRTLFVKLLENFGNPHLRLPPIIHVAGTNGKGSIIAMLRAILEAQGLRVHAFTSPHLIDVNERIVLAGEQIDDAYLEKLIDQALGFIDDAPLSFFEVISAVGFKAFSDQPADILLLEVGMGGELDCTNIIEKPLVSIVNRISMDHIDFLGNDIKDIARTKAGIMKAGVPCVIGYQGEEDMQAVFKEEAKARGASLLTAGRHWGVEKRDGVMVFEIDNKEHTYSAPNLHGDHQILNAGVVLAALYSISDKIKVDDAAIRTGLQNIHWPARMQKLDHTAYGAPEFAEIWLDVGHNDSAAEALAAQIKCWKNNDDKPVHLIFALLKTKDADLFLKPLISLVDGLHIVPISSDINGSQSIDDLSVENVSAHNSFQNALSHILEVNTKLRIIIAGSMYLAGEVLELDQPV